MLLRGRFGVKKGFSKVGGGYRSRHGPITGKAVQKVKIFMKNSACKFAMS
ncbi:hypothetical protein STSP2_00228 [Anaerohalosphaera lusitana]|uniref:Uncharacterized protein n=1 Tax=Anaerohalosphaera lusitana TaxID=1936003 RepID=A0A1U9NH58_9BACT|nr:hypothetical protein STSP2_00228 [Anaerohalosphaera lusitana]